MGRIFIIIVCVVNLILEIGDSCKLFFGVNKHNPYKYKRVSLDLAVAICFVCILSDYEPLWMPAIWIGPVLILVQLWFDRKDTPYLIQRLEDQCEARKKSVKK